MLHYGANEISNNVETSQSQLSNVHSSLRQNNNLENILPEVIKSFLELAAYYQKVSDNASQIKTTLENHQQALEKLQQRVADIIERLGKGQAEYSSIAERDQLLESHTELQQLKKKRLISADAYQKLAANVATRKKVWERLHQLQYEVIKPLPLYVENIQVLLHFMVSNAQVYQQAASETVLRNERLTGFTTNLDSLKQAVTIITQQEEILRTALENLGQKYEVTDKPR
jgi:phage shock protein A